MVGVYDFLRDSLPQMRQRRFGDLDYDFDFRVNTTAGTVGWHDRLLGIFHSPYQATDPDLFREMMASLPNELTSFVFIDIGSGKGRALLMASDYPFKKIFGCGTSPGSKSRGTAKYPRLQKREPAMCGYRFGLRRRPRFRISD